MKKIDNIQEKMFFICLILGCFFLYSIWALLIPFGEGPDETMRYQIPEFIYKYGYLPHGGDERIREQTWGISYGFTPILSYIFSAFFMKLTSLFSDSFDALLLSARFTSVLASTGTVFICTKIGKKLFDGPFRYVFVISIALLPQFAFISGYTNNDAFGIFTVSLVLYALLCTDERQWDFKSCIFLGISIGLCMLSYYNCYGIIVAAFFYAIVTVCTNKDIDNKFKFIFVRISWVAIAAFVVAGWWFIRNAIIYDGDFLGLNTSKAYSEKYAIEMYKPSNRLTPNNLHISLNEMFFGKKWLEYTSKSFIGVFGPMRIYMEKWNYRLIYIVAIVGALGSFIPKWITGADKKKVNIILIIACWLMCFITVSLSIYYSYFSDFQPQGRYCLPMLITLNIIIIYGWDSLTKRYYSFFRNLIAFLIILTYAGVLLYATYDVMIPIYAK